MCFKLAFNLILSYCLPINNKNKTPFISAKESLKRYVFLCLYVRIYNILHSNHLGINTIFFYLTFISMFKENHLILFNFHNILFINIQFCYL